MVFQLTNKLEFPRPELAEPDGLLAVGGDLSPERLILAYRNGIFPWFNPGEPILWYSTAPRLVLYPSELIISKSMKTLMNKNHLKVTYNQAFSDVMLNCSKVKRKGQWGSWIGNDMIQAYQKLHDLGVACSVEVWEDENLVAGLYGLSIGKIFFGESMFTKISNGSKFGFISLVQKLQNENYHLIDCQQDTEHLRSFGARLISRQVFLKALQENIQI